MLKFTIFLNPITKKNSQQIIYRTNPITKKQSPMIIPSKVFKQYQKDAGWFLNAKKAPEGVLNIKAIYYRETKHGVDITNLHSALHDVLTHYGVIEDDSFKFVGGTDGSRIKFDSTNPRTEIEITLLESISS